MSRHLALVVAILASVAAWTLPLVLADRYSSWWCLSGYLVTVPMCEAC